MKIKLKFAELQTPLFLNGVNHQTKIETERRGVKMVYDREQKELIIYHNGAVAILPNTNVASMTPANPDDFIKLYGFEEKEVKIENSPIKEPLPSITTPARGRPPRVTAQVSDPTRDHVFGQGK